MRYAVTLALSFLVLAAHPAVARSQGDGAVRVGPVPFEHATPHRRPLPPATLALQLGSGSGVRHLRWAVAPLLGAAVGGLLGAAFAQGQCERPRCDEWKRGLVAGAAIGAVVGGVVALAWHRAAS